MFSKVSLSLLKPKQFLRQMLSRHFCAEKDTLSLPIFDIESFVDGKTGDLNDCKKLVEDLRKNGFICIKDPRVNEDHNERFIDTMENYFETRSEIHYAGGKVEDFKPEYAFQVGSSPDKIERAKIHDVKIEGLEPENYPKTPQPPPLDGKWRFFWRIGEADNEDELLIAPQVIPTGFPHWEKDMNEWGGMMKDSIFTTAEMLALGMDLNRKQFTDLMEGSPQMLAPTGSDLTKYSNPGDILKGFDYDLNFITIHGRSRYPGLYIWLRDGTKMAVRIPKGCFLIQAAKQLEWLTGGYIEAGFHEILATSEALDKVEERKQQNKSHWRVGSTLFAQLQYDHVLEPLPKFLDEDNMDKYPPTVVYTQIEDELNLINLQKKNF